MADDQVDFIIKQWTRQRPDLDPSPIGVVGRISRAARYVDQLLQQNFDKFGLNSGEFDVLATLRRHGPPYQLTPTGLLNALMLSSGAMTNRLDRLEQAGYIERRPNPHDRRGILVALTDRGMEVIEAAMAAHVAYEQQLLVALTPTERQQLAALLRKLLLSFGDETTQKD